MAATKQDITRWLNEAPMGTTHMAVVCDTYDWDDYPVYVAQGEDPHEKLAKYEKGENMAKLMEVYKFSMSLTDQLNEHRAKNY